jgi:hypothetical protein
MCGNGEGQGCVAGAPTMSVARAVTFFELERGREPEQSGEEQHRAWRGPRVPVSRASGRLGVQEGQPQAEWRSIRMGMAYPGKRDMGHPAGAKAQKGPQQAMRGE